MCTVLAAGTLASLAGYGGATAAGLSTAATAASAIAGAAAGASAGADYEAAQYNEEVAKANADTLKAQALNEREVGSSEAQKKTVQNRQQTSKAAVELAGRGLDLSSGTAEDILANSAQVGAVDSMTILNNANQRAYGYETQADNLVSNAKQNTKRAKMGLGTSILTSAANPYFIGQL